MSPVISLNRLSMYSPSLSPASSPIARGQQIRPDRTSANSADNGRGVPDAGDFDSYECQTCKNRKYKDGSNDPGVSFKTPTRVSPERAAFAVRAHEAEHVSRAWAQAQKEGKEVVSQSVSYHTDICPECGRTYIAGGTTRTMFRSKPETYSEEPAKKGQYLDLTA